MTTPTKIIDEKLYYRLDAVSFVLKGINNLDQPTYLNEDGLPYWIILGENGKWRYITDDGDEYFVIFK